MVREGPPSYYHNYLLLSAGVVQTPDSDTPMRDGAVPGQLSRKGTARSLCEISVRRVVCSVPL